MECSELVAFGVVGHAPASLGVDRAALRLPVGVRIRDTDPQRVLARPYGFADVEAKRSPSALANFPAIQPGFGCQVDDAELERQFFAGRGTR